jgi:3alpha(or 20beta)-hydroxysteroid dehydrogenase
MGRIDGKVALITGAAGGMGATHARRFIKEGAKIVLADISEDAKDLADELGDNALFMKLDVTDYSNWEKVVKETEKSFGPINILVNNAGITGPVAPIVEHTVEDFKKIIDINQLGTFLGMKAVHPSMKKEGGSIINISSASGFIGTEGRVAYNSSKFAVRGMTKTAAKEFAEDNIRVNSVHPGPIKTGITSEERLNKFAEALPQKRVGEPEEITNLVLYLASDESSYSTGSEFIVDGGILA